MKRSLVLSLGIPVVAIMVALAVVVFLASRPREITVTVEAAAGTKISGNYVVDGVVSRFDTEAPASFIVTGRMIEIAVKKDDQPGVMAVTLVGDDSGQARTSVGPGETAKCSYEQCGLLRSSSKIWAGAVADADD
jgi:hypothetical protein